jgi:hypothetical protein
MDFGDFQWLDNGRFQSGCSLAAVLVKVCGDEAIIDTGLFKENLVKYIR